jgi:outer membrane protein TolC
MSRHTRCKLSVLLIALVVLTGCQPTQPFYLHEDGDLSHYLDKVTDLEYPDVAEASLADVTCAEAPFTLSDPEPREIWDLTLEDVVQIALQNSKVIRSLGQVTQFGFADALIERTAASAATVYDPALVESDPQAGVEAALSAFDAQLSMLGTNNGNFYNQTDRPNLFSGIPPLSVITRDNAGVRTELGKRTASGTQLFARNITEYQRGDNLIGGALPVNSVWETTFELEVRQPILRGRGAQVNRIPVVLARINADISLASFESSVRNFVLDIENTYWDLYLAYRFLETAKAGRDSAQHTWNAVYTKADVGTEGVQMEAQSREQYFFFRAALEQTLQQLYETESRLRFLMGLAATDGRLIRPIDEPTTARVQFDWRAIHCEALTRSPELRQLKWAIKRREMELIAARNLLLPQLDLGATYRWYGIGDNLINADRNGQDFVTDPDGSTAFDVLTQGDYQEAAFYLSFQMPVGYRRELAGVRNSQLAIAREKARLEDTELNQSHLLATSVRRLDYNYLNAQTQFNRWKASARDVATVEELYRIGKSSIDMVLDAQRRRAQSQRDYYQAVADYNKALAELHFRKGSLLEYNNVYLAEGPWPEKAYWDAHDRARERDASYYMDYGWSRPRVISQGPVAQHEGTANELISDGIAPIPEATESIPAPEPESVEPTPAAPAPTAPSPAAPIPGPITARPEGPVLQAPNTRASLDAPRKGMTRETSPAGFDWGNWLTTVPSDAGAVQPAVYTR